MGRDQGIELTFQLRDWKPTRKPSKPAVNSCLMPTANASGTVRGRTTRSPVSGPNPKADTGSEDGASGLNTTAILVGGLILVLIIVGTLMFMRRGGDKEDAFGMEGAFGADALDPTEQYVQQLIARATRKRRGPLQHNTSAAERQAAAQPAAAATGCCATSRLATCRAVYEQHYQQFVAQGYDAATAAAYAQQYAVQYNHNSEWNDRPFSVRGHRGAMAWPNASES